jgi:hypothetical protein
MTYKTIKDGITYFRNASSLETATTYFHTRLSDNTLVVAEAEVSEQIPEKTRAEKLSADKAFGQRVIDMYELENREIGPFTLAESLEIGLKFGPIEQLLLAGSISQALEFLQGLAVDAKALTQARKDSYIAMLTAYLEN